MVICSSIYPYKKKYRFKMIRSILRSSKMKNIPRPVNKHDVYHAHIYFDRETLIYVTQLYQRVDQKFGLSIRIGKIHQELVGPHPKWSCQITFTNDQFSEVIPWLDKNRCGLSVLVHGLSGDAIRDHTKYAYWLGDSISLNLSIFGVN
jgi:DOPA 4,5-dioxygenase